MRREKIGSLPVLRDGVLVWLATAARRRGVRVHLVILAEQHGRPAGVARYGPRRSVPGLTG